MPKGHGPAAATATISAGENTAPTASITAPATFRVGETITVVGGASDAQDQTFPDSAFSWSVLRRHATHTHPRAAGTGRSFSFPAPAPEDLAAAANSYVEVILTVRDSGGLTGTATRDLEPRKVQLTVATNPIGLRVVVNGTSFTGPATFTSWEGWSVTLDAPTPQKKFAFSSWSDGGARVHAVVTPATARAYTATFSKGRR